MILTITVALFCGMAAGYVFLDVGDKDTLDFILMTALDIMVFIAGIEIGSNRDILKRVCNLHSAVLALSIPAAVAVGSVIGAALIGMAVGLSLYDAVLVGSGFGWYSFSSVVISAMYSTEIGTVSFLANMLRELSAFFLIPLLVRVHKLLALAPSGAATGTCAQRRGDHGQRPAGGNKIYQSACGDVFLHQRLGADADSAGIVIVAVKFKIKNCLALSKAVFYFFLKFCFRLCSYYIAHFCFYLCSYFIVFYFYFFYSCSFFVTK